jgi:ubiquinone biosynthesis protein UbiJ
MMEIKGSVSSQISKLLQKYLDTDKSSVEAIVALNDSCLHVLLDPPRLLIEITFRNGEIDLGFVNSTEPDVIVTGKISDFFALLKAHMDGVPLASGTVSVEGDLGVAQKIQSLFSNLQVDLESILSRFFNPVLAHQIYLLISSSSSGMAANCAKIENDVIDYLRYESSLIAKRTEFRSLASEISNLCDQLENFESRVNIATRQLD